MSPKNEGKPVGAEFVVYGEEPSATTSIIALTLALLACKYSQMLPVIFLTSRWPSRPLVVWLWWGMNARHAKEPRVYYEVVLGLKYRFYSSSASCSPQTRSNMAVQSAPGQGAS